MRTYPYATVALTTASYTVLSRFIIGKTRSQHDLRTRVKAISAAHSTATTLIALYLLKYGSWPVDDSVPVRPASNGGKSRPDDTRNPIIAGKSYSANLLTAFEAGYLVYDTGALLYEAHRAHNTRGVRSTIQTLATTSPIFFSHHLALISSLLYLQHYIAQDREKGLWVIIAFLAMNASNPLLHLRWYLRKQKGSRSQGVDTLLAFIFALTRFGNVYWILKRYGEYHELGPLEGLRKQRSTCQSGTGVLVGVNAIWWLGLVRGIFRTGVK